MNKYIFVLIVCAVVFLICFLIDKRAFLRHSAAVFNFYLRAVYIFVVARYAVYMEIRKHGKVIYIVAVEITDHHFYAQLVHGVIQCILF